MLNEYIIVDNKLEVLYMNLSKWYSGNGVSSYISISNMPYVRL